MTNEPPRFAWEEDAAVVDEFLWEHGSTATPELGALKLCGAAEPTGRPSRGRAGAQALEEIAKRMDSDE